MTHEIAIRILFVKRLLDSLLPLIPDDQRGELKNFEDYMINIINVIKIFLLTFNQFFLEIF